MNVMTNESSIRRAVKAIMDASGVKTVIVAFVGEGAERYITNSAGNVPDDLKVYCWDKEGCTSPEAIEQLLAKSVQVYFVRNLHMKLYYAKGGNAVIGSANLSKNGFDNPGLHELVVEIPASSVDVAVVVESLSPRKVTAQELKNLYRRTNLYRNRNRGKDVFDSPRTGASRKRNGNQTFGEWMSKGGHHEWKIFVWDEEFPRVPEAIKKYVDSKTYDYWSATKWLTNPGEWILSINPADKRIEWSMPDHQKVIHNNDPLYSAKSSETHFAIQDRKSRANDAPFKCTERRFKRAVLDYLTNKNIITYQASVKRFKSNEGRLSDSELRKLHQYYLKLQQ